MTLYERQVSFVNKANKIHNNKYCYDKMKYINQHTKIEIICPLHGSFFQIPNGHLNGNGCPECKKVSLRMTLDEFLERAIKIHGDLYDYNNVVYTTSYEKVKIICKKHGMFFQTPNSHIIGKNGCLKCANDIQTRSLEEFIKEAIQIHGDRYNYNNVIYVNSYTPIEIICNIHGTFNQLPSSHIRGNGCKLCNTDQRKSNTSDFLKKAIDIHFDTYDYSLVEYFKSNIKIKIICSKHGVFEQTPNNHLNGKGCPFCSSRIPKLSLIHKTNPKNIKHIKLYLINLFNSEENFCKIGLTSLELDERFKYIPKAYNCNLIKYVNGDFEKMIAAELRILQYFEKLAYCPKVHFSGHTECFTNELIKYL